MEAHGIWRYDQHHGHQRLAGRLPDLQHEACRLWPRGVRTGRAREIASIELALLDASLFSSIFPRVAALLSTCFPGELFLHDRHLFLGLLIPLDTFDKGDSFYETRVATSAALTPIFGCATPAALVPVYTYRLSLSISKHRRQRKKGTKRAKRKKRGLKRRIRRRKKLLFVPLDSAA